MKKIFFPLVVALAFIACDNDDEIVNDNNNGGGTPINPVNPQEELDNSAFVLELLHYADVDGNETQALQNVDEFASLVNAFNQDGDTYPNTLFVSSGDLIIPGPRFYGSEQSGVRSVTGSNEPGHIDIAFANAMGVQASAIGNHELDAGAGEFEDAIKAESGGGADFEGSQFPFLSVNIDFSGDDDLSGKIATNGADVSEMNNKVAGYATIEIGGETIGLIGASSPSFPNITSTGDLVVTPESENISELASEIQVAVDALEDSGVNKIVLLSHMQQISVEKQLATLIDGIDIIVAGGSNTRMGDSNDVLYTGNTSFDENYPFISNIETEPTLIVNVDGDFRYLGRLVVGFDSNGVINANSLDNTLNGSYAAISSVVSQVGGSQNSEIEELQTAITGVIEELSQNVVGYSSVYLDGRRSQVRTQETNLGNLTADANLWYSNLMSDETIHVSIKNGGGIRTEIGTSTLPPGSTDPSDAQFNAPADNEISQLDLLSVLRFDNGLVRLTATAEQLKDIMEHAVAGSGSGNTPGQFPQIAGMEITVDLSGTARTSEGNGSRITKLIVTGQDGTMNDVVYENGSFVGDASRTYNLVTLNFLANGGDAYPFPTLQSSRINFYEGEGFGDPMDFPDGNLSADPGANSSFSDTGGEQDALAEYLQQFHSSNASAFGTAETDTDEDTRIIFE